MPRFRCVLFDCDSTLSAIEGIDELAREHKAEIERLTELAMRGELPLEAVYGRRLAIIRPSRAEVARVGALYVERLVAGARETVQALHEAGIEVRIVSGGLLPAVLHVGRALDIDDALVFAVDVAFDEDGGYAGFDETSPLARQGGKAALIGSWTDLPRPAMLVGDGATDLEAKEVVDRFVAFAGVEARAAVVAGGDDVVHAASLLPVLALALGDDVPRESGIRQLVRQGLELMS